MKKRIAFVGGGINSAVGYAHFVASRLDNHFELFAGVFSTDESVNRASGDRYSLPSSRVFQSIPELLERHAEELDAVVVLTPTPDHKENVIQSLEAGIDVICEKAIATNSADAEKIVAAAAQNDRNCLVTFNYTGYPAVREMRRLVLSGSIGEVIQINVEMPQESFLRDGAVAQNWRQKDYEIPTVSLDLGVHVLHLASFIADAGDTIEVQSSAQHRGSISTVIDNVNALVKYRNGMVGSYWWSKTALGYRNGLKVRIFGTQGSLEWHQQNPEELLCCSTDGQNKIVDRGNAHTESELLRPAYNRFKAGHPAGFLEAFANLYVDFAAILSKSEKGHELARPYSAREAARGLTLLEEIHGVG